MIDITIDDREIQAALNRMQKASMDLKPAFQEIGELLLLSVKRNFEEEGRPSHWKKSRRAAADSGQTLSDKGTLRNSFSYEATGQSLRVGTNIRYAAIHQFGGRTRAHTITAKKGKALAIPGIGFRKSVQHPGSQMPARPFLMIQDEDQKGILNILRRHLGDT
jgi:phage virion morphogenesis protein